MPFDIIHKITTNFITTLSYKDIKYVSATVKDITEALKINQSITTLNLSYAKIENDGAEYVAEALKINQSITTIDLGNNQISDDGVYALAEALKINQSITTLNLRSNYITNVGAAHIAEALKINHSITTIDLDNNQIGTDGALILGKSLVINKSATTIKISNYGTYGMLTLSEALKFNQYIAPLVNSLRTAEEELRTINRSKQDELKVKEAGKIVQRAKFREQKEVKALVEEKVKEYIPDVPVVKLFEVVGAGEDNQFHNDNQATICQVSNLVREGNDRLQEHGKKAILLLGNTGAGKSTLALLLSGRKLQALMDDETGDMVIEAMQPFENIVIGHKFASETKIPNKCCIEGGDILIWDCPGFNDTDPVQEIANSFYIKRLFEITDQLKFVLVTTESDLRSKRGNDFLEMLSNFMKSFKDVESIEGSVSLVVTQVSKGKSIQHIRKSIEKLLTDNQRTTEEHKRLINKLKYRSIHLFHRPNEEGQLVVPDLLAAIDSSSEYSNVESDMINIIISEEAKECSSHLLNAVIGNFNLLLEAIVKVIADTTKYLNTNQLNIFSENYNLLKDWIPSSIQYNNLLQKHDKNEYFLELDLLSKLQKVLNCDQIVNIQDAILIFHQAVEVFCEYVEPSNVELQHMIQGYGYCLQQQYEYVKFFGSVCGVELPDPAKISELITACHTKVTENLKYQVSTLSIDEKKVDKFYYHKAVKYLEDYLDSPACKNLKAIAYSCLANIVEQNGEKGAVDYYLKAIEANKYLPKIYEKLGDLLSNNNEYAKAIDYYKVVNSEFMIKECFKAWLKQDKNNPDIMLKRAEYFESIGLFEQAKKYYHYARSLSNDANFKAAALEKVGNIMVNAAAQGQDFITRAFQYDFYNYDLVDETFINNLLDYIVLKDLCC